jgi:preprotein translocase subunit SecG
MGVLMSITITLFIIISVFLILLILIQKGRGGGLASAFGGSGGNTAFGSKTGDVLTWATSIVFGVFILLSITLNLLAKNAADDTGDAPNPNAPVSSQVPQPAGDPGAKDDLAPIEAPVAPDHPTGVGAGAPAPAAAAAAAPATQPK